MKRSMLSALAVALVLGTAANALAEKKIDPAQWVPGDALVYVGVTDVDRMWNNFKKTNGYAVMNDETITEHVSELGAVTAAIEKLKSKLAEALDVQPKQLKNPFSGPLAFYLEVAPDAPDDLHPALVASVGDAELMKSYYKSATSKFKEHAKHESVSFGEYSIDVFTSTAEKADDETAEDDEFGDFDDDPSPFAGLGQSPDEIFSNGVDKLFSPEAMPPKLALCLTDDRLVVGTSADQVRAALKPRGYGTTLAETDDYQALLRYLKPVGSVRLVFNLPRVIEVAKANADSGDVEEMREWLRTFGVESLRSVVGHLRLGAKSYDSKFELLFLTSGQRSGLAEILAMDNRPTDPPDFVAADTCLYVGINLNVPRLIDQIERLVRQADAAAADAMRAQLESLQLMPDAEPINVRKDFIDHLREPLCLVMSTSKPVDMESVRVSLTMGHRDQSAIVRFLSQIPMLQAQELRGTQIFGSMMMPGFVLAPTAERLIIGSIAVVENAMSPSAAQPLAQSRAWQRAQRFVPSESWFTMFMDQRRMLEAALDLSKNGQLGMGMVAMNPGIMMLSQMYGEMAEALGDDPARIEKLLHYQGAAIITVTTMPEGVRLTGVNLKPEE